MGCRRPNPRLVKIHRSYAVDEISRVLNVHKNTVRAWIKTGLPIIDERRPTLVHGLALRTFLEERRKQRRQPCPPGHLYCVRCRCPRRPAGDIAEYMPITPTSGNLRGICPKCDVFMHRRVALARLDAGRGDVEVTAPEAGPHIGE